MEWEPFIRLLAAAGFAGLIGLDRELRAKPAGLRTNIVVGVAAGAFAYVGLNAFSGGDPSRVAAQIVSGIGFLGGGAIFAAGGKPHGLTTAAALWGSAAAGLAAGVGAYATGLAVVAVTVLALWPLDRAASSLLAGHRRTNMRIAVVTTDLQGASRARAMLGEVGIAVDQLEMRPFGEQGVAMELVVHATRSDLEEAVGRLRLHSEVLFVSEEAVPPNGPAGLRSSRGGRDPAHLQGSLGLPSESDMRGPPRRRRRGASGHAEKTARQRRQKSPARPSHHPETSNSTGFSRTSTIRRLPESNNGARFPDPDPRSWDRGNNMRRDRDVYRSDPFAHLQEAGMKRLSEAQEAALLADLKIGLWDPPIGLLLHKEVSLQARIILGGFRVYDIVPRRFQAYARVFHPLQGHTVAKSSSVGVRWSDVADGSSDTLDCDARLACIQSTAARLELEPLIGVLDHSTAVSLAEVLKRHTRTPSAIYCLFRSGLAEFGNEEHNIIYQAPIDIIGSLYPYGRQTYLSPTLWWDAAGEWFVATHPDSSSTYLGGSGRLVWELSTLQQVEAVEVKPQTFVDVVISARPA